MSLTAERVRELLEYDADTGILRWRVRRGTVVSGRIAGHLDAKGYMALGIDGRLYRLHRVVWLHVYGAWPTQEIDHINRVRHDNRLANLRDVSRLVNARNKGTPTARGPKVVRVRHSRPGRPCMPEDKRYSRRFEFRCMKAQREKFERLGGLDWLRAEIDNAPEPA
jgi:hypothetical protein